MAEPLKNVYTKAYIQRLAKELAKAGLKFDEEAFVKRVLASPWRELELKARTTKICLALHAVLPKNFKQACAILKSAGKTFGGYEGMFFPEYVGRFGLEDWEVSMQALEVLTGYSSAEFAIRPFLIRDPERAMAQMYKWSRHENEHVRRLASEGARPLLPWAEQLPHFRHDPSLNLNVLENLKEDESLYVKKSVANHLNDISKDHPELAIKVAKEWIKTKNPHSLWIVKHGMRTLLKRGDQKALGLFGYGKKSSFSCSGFTLDKQLVHMGEELVLSFEVDVRKSSTFRMEYGFYFLKANGNYTKKVFKINEKELRKGLHEFEKKHLFKLINTRRYYDGLHFVELIINGYSMGVKPFILWHERSAYQVYMMETEKGTIYTGVTTDVNRRFEEHRTGVKGAKYTKANTPKQIIYLAPSEDRSSAQKKESAYKKLTRDQKINLSWQDTLEEFLG